MLKLAIKSVVTLSETKEILNDKIASSKFVSRIFMNYIKCTWPNFHSPSIKVIIKFLNVSFGPFGLSLQCFL